MSLIYTFFTEMIQGFVILLLFDMVLFQVLDGVQPHELSFDML